MKKIIVLSMLAATAVSANAAWYTSEASFLAALASPNYTENFSGFTFGTPLSGGPTWNAPGANGYGWTADSVLSTGGAGGGLYSNISALSLNTANQLLRITSTGAGFTAFGARLSNSDINGNIIAGTNTINIAGVGSNSVANAAGQYAFLGWVGTTTITSATLTSTSTATNNWVQADTIIVGQPVPEPATMAALGLGALAIARRRRASK